MKLFLLIYAIFASPFSLLLPFTIAGIWGAFASASDR